MSHLGLPTAAWFAVYGFAAGAALGIPLSVLCAPVLASGSIRRLVALGPTRVRPVNYVLAVVTLAAVQGAAVGALSVGAPDPLAVGNATMDVVVSSAVAVWLLAVVGLPRRGYEWRGNRPLRSGAALAVALGWYALIAVGPVVLLTAVASL